MTELLYSHSSAFEILKLPIIMIIIIGLAPVAVFILKKLSFFEKSQKKEDKIAVIIAIFIVSVMLVPFIVGRTIYAIEVATENKTTIVTELPKLSSYNSGMYFYFENKKIEFKHDKQKTEYLEGYFVGNLCEIEYYKITKRVIRITLLE